MFNNGSGLSASDVLALTDRNKDNDGWGADGAWWIIIFVLFFAFGGWGRGGWGEGSGTSGGLQTGYATQADLQRGFDNQLVVGKLDRLGDGICSLGYDILGQTNAINQNVNAVGAGIQNAIQQTNTANLQNTFAIQQAINADTVANMQNTNALATQLADCCCTTQRAIDQTNYNLATQSCATNTQIANSARDIVDSQNAGTQAVLAKLSAMEMNAKDSQIAQLTADNQALRFNASQTAQNAYLVGQLRPYPVPSFPAANMYGYMFGANSGCCGMA